MNLAAGNLTALEEFFWENNTVFNAIAQMMDPDRPEA